MIEVNERQVIVAESEVINEEINIRNEGVATRETVFKENKEKLHALFQSETWMLVDKPEKEKIISNKWVFRIKENEKGNMTYKARLVARGFEQNIQENSYIHAPVARLSSLRILLAACNYHSMYLDQLDVKNAFLNGKIKEKCI